MGNGIPHRRDDTGFYSDAAVPWIASLFVVAVFFLAEHDLSYTVSESIGTKLDDVVNRTAEGSFPRRMSFLLMGLFACIALLRGGGYRLSLKDGYGLIMLLFLGWTGLSILWAEDVALTFRRLVVLAAFCLTAAAFCKRLQLRQIIWVVFLTSGILLVIGLISELSTHTFLPFSPEYRFHGTLHPNMQSIQCVLIVFSALALRAETRERFGRFFLSSAAGIAAVFLILTKSRTSFMSMVIAFIAFRIIKSPNFRKHGLILSISIVALLFLLFGGALLPSVMHGASLGRDQTTNLTLNGRTSLWSACLSSVDQAKIPLLGFGYGGFWTPERIEQISINQNWGESLREGVGTAHSMYMEIFLALGLIGLLLYVSIILGGIRRAIQYYHSTGYTGYGFIIVLLIFCMFQSTLESSPINHSFYTLAFFHVLVFLGFREPYRFRGDPS